MKDSRVVLATADHALEDFAAKITAVAYPVALRHGAGEQWLDLELDLWRAVTESLQSWKREVPRAG
jgi:hypothetical protein